MIEKKQKYNYIRRGTSVFHRVSKDDPAVSVCGVAIVNEGDFKLVTRTMPVLDSMTCSNCTLKRIVTRDG